MPLQKIALKPGVNRENTRYTNEGGWYESDKVRFRQGTPEKIGGWARISANYFLGVCRSLWNWVTLAAVNLLGVGTNLKFYIENEGTYYDITPITSVRTLTNPFSATGTSTTVTVTDAAGGYAVNSFVTFNGATAISALTVGGVTLSGEYQITSVGSGTYTITAATTPTAGTSSGIVYASYQLAASPSTVVPLVGWGAGTWGTPPATTPPDTENTWGYGVTIVPAPDPLVVVPLSVWNQNNFGQNLIYGPRGGALYYWDATVGYAATTATITIAVPGVVTSTLTLANNTPITLQTTGFLPVGLIPGTVYYTRYVSSTTFNLATSTTSSATLSGVSITGVAGQFSCTTASVALVAGQSLTITGAYGGTGSITGYTNPTTYYIVATNGSTTFTLSTTAGGAGVVTTAGTPTGLTYTLSTTINTSGSQSGTHSISPRGVAISALAGASDTPLSQNFFTVSDASRFVICFGTNDYLSTVFDPMLIRWSDQESVTNWTPAITNQSGSIRLSHGSKIVTALQSRQEILVWTDSTIYSMQYLGPPYVWGTTLLGDNVSIAGPNAAALASGVTYWMGVDKFYKYDGRVQTLNCDLLRFIYNDINRDQFDQVFASTNEGFNEVWWFYCTADATENNRYVVYNYLENVWYYGSMERSAWLDTGLRNYPLAATYDAAADTGNIVYHEYGVDDNTTGTAVAISSSITSAQFDIGDGNNFAFVWRMLPDLTFNGSTAGTTPSLTIQLQPLQNSGSSYNDPISIGGTSVTGTQTVNTAKDGVSPIYTYPQDPDIFTGQLNIRVRGRQMSMRIACNTLGTQWQMGSPRVDTRPDGRRGG